MKNDGSWRTFLSGVTQLTFGILVLAVVAWVIARVVGALFGVGC